MELYFTQIIWAGTKCILVTDDQHCRKPLLILNEQDIERLHKEFQEDKTEP